MIHSRLYSPQCRQILLLQTLLGLVVSFPTMAADDAPKTSVDITEYHWSQGEKPVRMIKRSEGFCYLSGIQGHFGGAGESLRVYLGEDDYWYLGGASQQQGVGGSALAVKFDGGVKTVMHQAPPAARLADLIALTASKEASIRDPATAQIKDYPDDPKKKVDSAQAWLALARKDTTPLKIVMERHATGMLAAALPALEDVELAGAIKQQIKDLATVFARDHLNDLSQWSIVKGQWDTTAEGRIRGRGDSEIAFNNPLPTDGTLSFHVKIKEGMRPRIRFEGTGLYVGNEGYDRVLEAHGPQTQNGVRFPYAMDQDIAIAVKFTGQNFELRINNEVMSKGTLKAAPDLFTLRLSAGDDWSFGTCEFWGLQYSPAEKAK